MLRKLIIAIVVVNFVFMLAGVFSTFRLGSSGNVAIADPNIAQFGVGAQVPEFLEINAILRTVELDAITGEYDINWNSNPGSLDFGTLVEINDTQTNEFYYMAGATAYAVVMYPVSSGRAYTLTETGTELANGQGAVIPNAAYVMTPDYQYLDTVGGVEQEAMPGGASLSAPQSAVGNHQVFQCPTTQEAVAVRAFLAITGPDINGNIMNYAQGHNNAQGVGQGQYYQGNGQNNWSPVTQNQPPGAYSGSVILTLNLQ